MFRKPSNKLLVTIADNLKKFRASQSLSQEDFSGMSGLHRTYIRPLAKVIGLARN